MADEAGDARLFYERQLSEFGANPIDSIRDRLPDHRYVRRNIIFGHKGMKRVLDAVDAGEEVCVVTGTMPSGPFHLGHCCLVEQLVLYQEMGLNVAISLADIEAYVARGKSLEDSRKIGVEEYLTALVALGVDLEQADLYFQSEGSNSYYTLGTLLSRNLSAEEFERNYGNLDPGKIATSLLQYADILKPQLPESGGAKPTVTPIGIDQENHIATCRSLADAYERQDLYTPSVTYHRFLRGFNGGKMSSSKPSTFIALSDDVEDATAKIDALEAGPLDRSVTGDETAADILFDLLEFHLIKDDAKLDSIVEDFSTGALSFEELKHITIERLAPLLREFQDRRAEARPMVEKYVNEHTTAATHQ